MNTILTWILNALLNWIVGRLTSALKQYEDQLALDKQRGKIDEGNAKKYEEAKDRLERHAAAVDLLNGTP